MHATTCALPLPSKLLVYFPEQANFFVFCLFSCFHIEERTEVRFKQTIFKNLSTAFVFPKFRCDVTCQSWACDVFGMW